MSSASLGFSSPTAAGAGQDTSPLIDPQRPGPIRAELLGLEGLGERARRLAGTFKLATRRRVSSPLLSRFMENRRVLVQARKAILGTGRQEIHGIDADWLADNFHIVDEALREVRQDLPRGYDAILPKLESPPLAGYPRVYALALALLAHTDSELDEPRITRFVQEFQQVVPLTIGELWALPTMCRLVLIENLRRLAEQMLWGWNERLRAERWWREVLDSRETPGRTAQEARPGERPPPLETLNDPFVVRLLQLLRDEGEPALAAVGRIEEELGRSAMDQDAILARESHRQASNQVTIGNCVVSLRLLSTVDWNQFFEKSSLVQQILLDDPSGAYPLQEFTTSDRCRKAVEKIARESNADETDVAGKAIALARAGSSQSQAKGHVGYYLVGPGEQELRASFICRMGARERLLEGILARPRAVYFGSLSVLLGLMLLLFVYGTLRQTAPAAWFWYAIMLLVVILPLSDLAVGLLNHVLTLFLPPRVLPKLEFKERIPGEFSTFVVIPSLLVRPQSALVLCERLETHYLANPIAGVRFALLTDFADAPQEEMADDRAFLDDALHRVRELNRRYAGEGPDLFYLFHRRRLWNAAQGCWMGWERKRGKLSEFNRLLRGDRNTTYAFWSSDPETLPRIRFVITLDADTQMPRDTVGRLIGTLAHPLNQPRFDERAGRVVEGYGVLQPRVSFHLTAATHSQFAALLATSGGIDPYSTAASDAYMDLFGLGSFTGKGIYDVDAFESATGKIFPENRILSHDLIEGNYARCGLLSDTELFDDFPARYLAYARREHRWVRGDWQLIPWLGPRVPIPEGELPNPLPALERWKLLDNLRRSLVPPALIAMLTLGWTILPGSRWLGMAITVAVLALPLLKWLIGAVTACVRTWSLVGVTSWRERIPALVGQAVLSLVFLLDQARLNCDAIVRTLWRLLVTRRRLLEWETAAAAEQRLGSGVKDFAGGMSGTLALAVAITLLVGVLRPGSLWAAAPVLTAWLVSPMVAFWVSRPRKRTEFELTDEERRALRRLARKTWRFFETFVGDEDHWLPPDNYQVDPDGRVAHRTSPTNQGLLLLSTLAAHDLGYIGLGKLVDRLERTLDSLERMEKHWGHFLNWYDTRTLQPLSPAYISTVDSGNFLGCLVALKQGLSEKLHGPVMGPAVMAGLADTLRLIDERHRPWTGQLETLLEEHPDSMPAWEDWLGRVEDECQRLVEKIEAEGDPRNEDRGESRVWAKSLLSQVRDRRADLVAVDSSMMIAPSCRLRQQLLDLIARAEVLGAAMDFRPLYKSERHLYAIGVNLSQGEIDRSCYDLLASEACLTSYLTVARGDAPRRHWFMLGRPYIKAAGRTGLISWGGTMFEYLMPRLLLRSLPGTLLAEACRTAVARQIEYGRRLGIPWGVSESAFNDRFLEGDYRYSSFGVPGLGLKRGLENDQVVAPYATAMATMIAPREALANLRRLASEGAEGPFGFFEAIDYTHGRLAPNGRPAVVRSYMAHHQGMSLLGLTNVLCDDVMPRRFHGDPMVRAADLLLEERVPPDPPIAEPAPAGLDRSGGSSEHASALLSRRLTSPFTVTPRTHLLSNSYYHVMITNAGSGWSKCQGLNVTRWREDSTCEGWGQFFYLRDLKTGMVWSAGHQPVCRSAERYEVVYSADKATIRRRDGDVETQLEIAVSPEHMAEVRRITLSNHGNQPRELEVTSYLEPTLCEHGSDLAHPALAKLFLETEHLAESDALLCRRRTRSPHERPAWAVHVLAVDRLSPGYSLTGSLQFETDRARFLGRGRSLADPAALDANSNLSGTVGPVLDPVLSLRRRFRIMPGGSAVFGYTLALVESRDAACALADQYHGISAVARAFDLAWAHSQVKHGQQNGSADDTHLYQRLGTNLLFAGSALRGRSHDHGTLRPASSVLHDHGISGDRAVILARIAEPAELSLVRQLLVALDFLRARGVESNLVLLSEERAGQGEDLKEQILELLHQTGHGDRVNQPSGIQLIERERITDDELGVIEAAAWVVLDGSRGSLAGQLDRIEWSRPLAEPARWPESAVEGHDEPVPLPTDLLFWNGMGGFSADGREYCIYIGQQLTETSRYDGQPEQGRRRRPTLPPAPWVNVIANPEFGFLISESGSGFTWAGNSQTNRLTSWSNDPVVDPASEAVYLRDELTGEVWSPTPLPVPSRAPTLVRHGQGYTVFERNTHGIAHELCMLVPQEAPIKLVRLRLRNTGSRRRTLSATYYVEWVLGMTRERSARHVVSELDPDTGALLARNPFREGFSQRIAFADVNRRPRTFTADRVEFLGRHGSTIAPAALNRVGLSGRTGAGLDSCAALQTGFQLEPKESIEIIFTLGEADDLESARALIRRFWEPSQSERALEDSKARWDRILRAVQVRTSDPAFDLLINRWLLYQVTSCRLWARSAFYQSGGAYGMRDQLQDVLALVHAAPELAREQILRAASRQFVEGDVQHWWHPPMGQGVRTRIADDRLWLPYATAHYVTSTGDSSILDEVVSYLEAAPLEPGQEAALSVPSVSHRTGSLYEHCTRALEHASRLGPHGLPLMEGGDWNDGMNRVGALGRGESVWLAWFLSDCLRRFAGLAASRGDAARSDQYARQSEDFCAAVERHAWDGSWYLRAFFDDGTPLGSARADECQIDSIAQSWSVISGSADPKRSQQAMRSVVDRLARKDDGLILVLAPPFDGGSLDPGYIKGYPPGTRENGAQYTHAAVWVVQAMAQLGHGGVAYELFQNLSPVRRTADLTRVRSYKVEPYVIAGDVYSLPPHVGRGGWTWYTGAAGWLYRVGLETILGLHRSGDLLRLDPTIPSGWSRFELSYQFRSTTYEITVENPLALERGVKVVLLDGNACESAVVPLVDDGQVHKVRVVLGNA